MYDVAKGADGLHLTTSGVFVSGTLGRSGSMVQSVGSQAGALWLVACRRTGPARTSGLASARRVRANRRQPFDPTRRGELATSSPARTVTTWQKKKQDNISAQGIDMLIRMLGMGARAERDFRPRWHGMLSFDFLVRMVLAAGLAVVIGMHR